MRNSLLVFFSGYKLNRHFTKLKLPRSLAMAERCKKTINHRAGTCPWRGLHAAWTFNTRSPRTLLDYSQVKQYKLGFDSTLPEVKSTHGLKELARLRFGINYTTLTKDYIFYNFFYNHGTYNTTTNNSINLWYSAYKPLLTLANLLRKKKLIRYRDSRMSWGFLWPNQMLTWSLITSGKFNAITPKGYLNDSLIEEYDDFFYMLSVWEQNFLSKDPSAEYYIDTDPNQYVMPEFFSYQEVSILPVFSLDGDTGELVYAPFSVAKLLEDRYFKSMRGVTLTCSGGQRAHSYRSLLLSLAIN